MLNQPYCIPITDCSRVCPQGGSLEDDCSYCLCGGDQISGIVRDRDSGLTLANVNIYTVHKQWTPSAVSRGDGTFTIYATCEEDLKLTARKDGYMSKDPEYPLDPFVSPTVILMIKLGAYKDRS